jgi:SAM-dependent methyltransferase
MKANDKDENSTPVQLSFGIDKSSSLFLKNGYCERLINSNECQFYRTFLSSSCAKSLVRDRKLIPSDIISSASDDHLKLRHPEIRFVLYPYEWPPAMLKDAALMYLDLLETLEASGYTLKDGHPWNVVFDSTKPIWVDLTSVADVPSYGSFPGQQDFVNYFVRPLSLFANGLDSYARLCLTQLMGPPAAWIETSGALDAAKAYTMGAKSCMKFALKHGMNALVQKRNAARRTAKKETNQISILREMVSALDPTPSLGTWSNYYTGMNELPFFSPPETDVSSILDSTAKHEIVSSVIKELRPESVLDIGCNSGLYTFIAESFGADSIGIDTDESALSQMYIASKSRERKITSGFADFVTPMQPAEYLHKPRLRSLHSRVSADLTLCLAVVHHWVFKRLQLQFADVVQILSKVSRNSLIVEFVPHDDKHVSQWMTAQYSWYTLAGFIAELQAEFTSIEVHESFPSPRKLIVCRR